MASIKVADLFAQIGARVDVRQLNKFQKRLVNVKKQLLALKRIARTPLSPNTNIRAVRNLNTELSRTLRLARQIQSQGPISVRRRGGPAGGRPGRIGPGIGGGSVFGGVAAGAGAGRVPVFARNFVAGFGGAIVVRQLFQATAAMQGIEVALGAVTREGQTTAEVMSFLRFEADRLGFEFSTSALEFAKLAAAGNALGSTTAEIQEIFISAQEAARVFNLSTADTAGVLKAFTQILSKGKVTAEELRNQLGDRLPAAVPIFAKALGVTTQELGQMLEKGEILAKTALPLFAKELRETFAKQVPAAARNLTASFNRFKTTLFEFSAGLGKAGLGKIFSLIFIAATNALKTIRPVLKFLVTGLRLLVTPLQAIGRIFVRLQTSVPRFTALLIGAGTAMFFLRNVTLASAKAFIVWALPLIAGGLAVTALILLIDDLATALEGGDSILGRMADSGNIFARVFARILLIFGQLVIFAAELTAALFTLSFDPLTDSLNRFISRIRELTGLAAASGFITDILERAFINAPNINAPIPSLAAVGGASLPPINVTITGDTGVIREVAIEAAGQEQEIQNRQAQAEFGNNE